jgi:hypothetical protein
MHKICFPASEISSHPNLLVDTVIIVFILVVVRTYNISADSVHVKFC